MFWWPYIALYIRPFNMIWYDFVKFIQFKREKMSAVKCFFCTVSSFLGAWQEVGGWLQLLVGQPVPWQLDQYILECSTRSTTGPKPVSNAAVASGIVLQCTAIVLIRCQTGYQYIPEVIWNSVAWTWIRAIAATQSTMKRTHERQTDSRVKTSIYWMDARTKKDSTDRWQFLRIWISQMLGCWMFELRRTLFLRTVQHHIIATYYHMIHMEGSFWRQIWQGGEI